MVVGIVWGGVFLGIQDYYNRQESKPVGIQLGDEVCISGIGMVRGMPYPDTMIICGELKLTPDAKVKDETGL